MESLAYRRSLLPPQAQNTITQFKSGWNRDEERGQITSASSTARCKVDFPQHCELSPMQWCFPHCVGYLCKIKLQHG